MKRAFKQIVGDSLYRNSLFLIASNAVTSVLGFFFWGIATKYFNPSEVGVASTLISSAELVMSFSLLGLNMGLVRYLPSAKDKDEKINSVLTATTILSVVFSILFILSLNFHSPSLKFIQTNYILLTIFFVAVITVTMSECIKNIFKSYRSSQYVLIKNLIINILKIVFIFFLFGFGSHGLFSSWVIALTVSCIFGLIVLIKIFGLTPKLQIKIASIKPMLKFSGANYISEFIEKSPKQLLPLITINKLGPQITAYYYIDMSITLFLYTLAEAIGSAFYAEATNNENNLSSHIKKSFYSFLLVLTPAVFFIYFFGGTLLTFFGKDYSQEGLALLKILSLSTYFVALNSLFSNIIRVKYKVKRLVIINAIGAITILGISYLLMEKSITGIGWGFLIGNGLMNILYVLASLKYKS